MKITYRPIGIIHSPFNEPKGTPIQPKAAKGIGGMIEVFPQYEKGLKDIEGFSHIILIYHFHLSKAYSL
jgi:tRNA (Thr-GGU) A37 N-methylase